MSTLKTARISTNLRDFITLFEFLSTIKELRLRKKLVKHLSANDKFNQAIREIAHNIVKLNVPLSPQDKKTLRPFGSGIVKLAAASNPKKRCQVVQRGKGVLLSSALTALAFQLLNGIIN